jgi:Nucleotidyl transferase AbiEii toxin, Type IV TA system
MAAAMAADRRPGNLAHLERLLNAWSRDNTDVQATAGRLRRLVAISVLATILDGLDQGGAPRLAFKGGAGMEIRFGVVARASRDVDALVNVSLDDAFAEIGERLNAGWEGFTATLTERTEVTRAGITPAPQRCKIKLAYHDRPFATLAFEVSRAEVNSFQLLEQIPNAVDMDKVQLGPAADVVVLSVHYQIAQKLHVCTEVPAEGSNPRVHDIYDILLLAGIVENARLAQTRAACEDTFTPRRKHAWPPALPAWDDWEQIWDALDVPDDARYSYADARQRFEQLIRQIAEA